MSDALDDFLTDEDEDDDGTTGSNTANDERLSAKLHREEKARAALEKKLEAAEARIAKGEAEARKAAVTELAKKIGLKDKHVEFFPADAEPETLAQWAVDNEFIESDSRKTDEKSGGFEPGGFGGSEVDSKTGYYSVEEVVAIYNSGDREKAAALVAAGKVAGISDRGKVDPDHPDFDIDYGGEYRYY